MINLNELKKKAYEHSKKRAENGGTKPLKHCATEVIEATEAYSECRFEEDTIHFEAELADIICCVLIIAENEKIDIEQALLECIEKNRKRAEGTGDKR